ncbi:MAG: membrane protein insertase YidC [Candidatus Omnitrophota bacterium]
MEKRLIIAIALSLIILLAFQRFFKAPPVREGQKAAEPTRPVAVAPTPAPAPAPVPEELPKGEETVVQTEKHTIVFTDIGGAIKEIDLRDFKGDKEEELVLCKAGPGEGIFAISSPNLPEIETGRYKMTRGENFIEYRLVEPGVAEVTKRYSFYKSFNYMDLSVLIKNLSSRNIHFSYEIKGPSGVERTEKITGRSFLESATMVDDKVLRKKSVKGMQEKTGSISWAALKNRYFALILKPFNPPYSAIVREAPDKGMSMALRSRVYTLKPGESIEDSYLIYGGTLSENRLAAIGYGMENVLDYGIFGGVSKMLLSILRFFHKGTRNWGVAIILLTMLINAVLFPLTKKSVTSMHQMKTIQPHMQKLKELHKDNPQKLNKEMMELYKKYNVNPLSGCLPLLLQMPVFIALYQGLIRSVELKGASFLWIKDLARPDAVKLPFSLPVIGASINILPLLMVGMMVVQQRISQGATAAAMTDEQASQQKMMMVVFPLVFGFLFYNMPSGLVLYWLTNTVLMTAEQKLMARRFEHE